jgi:hypothetical protein
MILALYAALEAPLFHGASTIMLFHDAWWKKIPMSRESGETWGTQLLRRLQLRC